MRELVSIFVRGLGVVTGMTMLFPYFSLQMEDLGLTVEDISLINGILPFVTFFALPVSGFIGDKIGYRTILILEMLVAGATSTYFAFIPTYVETVRLPSAALYKDMGDGLEAVVASVQWAPEPCSADVSVALCQSSFLDLNRFANLTPFRLECDDEDVDADGVTAEWLLVENVKTLETDVGTFCLVEADVILSSPDAVMMRCDIDDYPGLDECVDTEGSKAKTFWIYFVVRMVFTWAFNSIYPLLDSTGVILADQYDSDYSIMMIWSQVAACVGPFVSGYLVTDAEEGSGATNDYTLAYYVNDACLVLTCLVVLKLHVQKHPSVEKTSAAIKKIFSIPALVLFAILGMFGFMFGARDSLYSIYLQDELGADTKLISNTFTVGGISGLIILPFGNFFVRLFGEINLIVFAIFLEASRYVMMALITQSPPYYTLYIAAFDSFVYVVNWLAIMTYVYKIAPPDLVSTMTATVHVVEWVIMKGVGSLVVGALLGVESLELADIWLVFAGVGAAVGLAVLVIYHTFAKRFERRLIREKERLIEQAGMKEAAAKIVDDNVKEAPDEEEEPKEDAVAEK